MLVGASLSSTSSCVTWLSFVAIISLDRAWCETQEGEDDDDEEEEYETRHPYPKTPVEVNWSYEMAMRPHDQPKVHSTIDNFFTELIDKMSYGDPKKAQQLTLKHNWVPYVRTHCFDQLRIMLSMYCVEWKLSSHVRKYGYVLVNMCNAAWLESEDIEEIMAETCENKRVPDDQCS